MVKKKLLTLDDLVLFCQKNDFTRFSAKESGYQLAVQVPTTFEIEDESDDNHRGMLRLKFRILHDGLNRNGSFVSHEAAQKAAKTIADRPIMAAIHKLDDGSYDFEAHEMEIIENDEGDYEVNYIEKQVGSFSSEKPFWEHDDELNKDYLCAYGYVAEEYTKAADIIRNKGWTKNSCELNIEELAYNSKEKYLELKSFYLSASTLLGKRDDGTEIGEGMLGSRADIADFSEKNNSIFSQNEKVIEMLSALTEKIDNLNINSKILEEGGTDVKKKFEEDSEAEVKTTAEVDSTEETEVDTPSENFDGDGDTDPDDVDYYGDDGDGDSSGNDSDPSGDGDDTPSGDDPDPEPSGDGDDTEPEPSGDDEDEPEGIPAGQKDDDDADGGEGGGTTKKPTFSVSISHGETVKEFSISLQDKIEALYTLVNDTYSEADGCYYDCTVYDEDKYVIMSSWWTGNAYKQSYKVKKDVYSLVGDRVKVKAVWCTEDEEKALENMRANYSSIEERLAQYESEPEKIQILESADYAQIKDIEAYKELAKRDTYFSMSKDELVKKLDSALLEFAKHNKIEFSSTEPEKKSVGMKLFGNPSKKTTRGSSRYGELFSK